MILSLPIDAWLLLFVAVGFGLALEVAYYRARRADWKAGTGGDAATRAGVDDAAGPGRPGGDG